MEYSSLSELAADIEAPIDSYTAITQEEDGQITFWKTDTYSLHEALKKRTELGGTINDYLPDSENLIVHQCYFDIVSDKTFVANDWLSALVQP